MWLKCGTAERVTHEKLCAQADDLLGRFLIKCVDIPTEGGL